MFVRYAALHVLIVRALVSGLASDVAITTGSHVSSRKNCLSWHSPRLGAFTAWHLSDVLGIGRAKKRVKEGVVKIQLSHMDVELADLDADKAAVWRASWTASQLD